MANFKHKVFLLIAKWIPVAVAAGILINNTLAMLAGKHFNEPYAIYQVSQMYHTNNKGVKIDTPLFSIENAKKIYDRRIRPLNKDVTMWDVYVVLNAQYHDNIDLYEKWFSNANDSEIEEKIIEATIANWFEDEDASSDKVWEYFRVI